MKNKQHKKIQKKIINKLILFLGFFAIPAQISSLSRIYHSGWINLYSIQFIVVFAIILIALLRNQLSYYFKVLSLIFLSFILGIGSSLNYGFSGLLVEYFMTAILISLIFIGRKAATITFSISSLSFLLISFLHVKGILKPIVNLNEHLTFSTSWIGIYSGFAFIAVIVIMTVGEIGYILSKKINELTMAHEEVKKLQGILPICANCKKIRDSKGYWNKVESYIEQHSEVQFSHGICQECAKKLYGDDIVIDEINSDS